MLYEEILAKSAEYGIECTVIDKRGDKLSALEEDYCFVKSLIGNPDARQEYLDNAERGRNKNRRPSMVESLHRVELRVELIESLFVVAKEAAEIKDNKRVKELCAEIEHHLKHEVKILGAYRCELYRRRINKLLKLCGNSPEEQADSVYRNLVISAIEHVEQAYSALQGFDFISLENHLSKAEDILPEADDENIRLLSNHISKLRSEAERKKRETDYLPIRPPKDKECS